MDFKRKKVRGKSKKVYREWYDESRQYRIVWRREVYGVRVPARFYATIWTHRYDGKGYWEFAAHRRPYKTMQAAVDACLLNKRLWDKFIELGQASGNRIGRLRELVERSKVGSKADYRTIVSMMIPKWVLKQADPRLVGMLQAGPKRKPGEDEETSHVTDSQSSAGHQVAGEDGRESPGVEAESPDGTDLHGKEMGPGRSHATGEGRQGGRPPATSRSEPVPAEPAPADKRDRPKRAVTKKTARRPVKKKAAKRATRSKR